MLSIRVVFHYFNSDGKTLRTKSTLAQHETQSCQQYLQLGDLYIASALTMHSQPTLDSKISRCD